MREQEGGHHSHAPSSRPTAQATPLSSRPLPAVHGHAPHVLTCCPGHAPATPPVVRGLAAPLPSRSRSLTRATALRSAWARPSTGVRPCARLGPRWSCGAQPLALPPSRRDLVAGIRGRVGGLPLSLERHSRVWELSAGDVLSGDCRLRASSRQNDFLRFLPFPDMKTECTESTWLSRETQTLDESRNRVPSR